LIIGTWLLAALLRVSLGAEAALLAAANAFALALGCGAGTRVVAVCIY